MHVLNGEAKKCNEHSVYFPDRIPKDDFGFQWLGATVKFRLFDMQMVGVVHGADALNHTLTVVFREGNKSVAVTGPYQAFHRIEKGA